MQYTPAHNLYPLSTPFLVIIHLEKCLGRGYVISQESIQTDNFRLKYLTIPGAIVVYQIGNE